MLFQPLPAKHNLQRFDRFSNEFVNKRQAGLQVFLQRIAGHPVLSFNRFYHAFLTAKQSVRMFFITHRLMHLIKGVKCSNYISKIIFVSSVFCLKIIILF